MLQSELKLTDDFPPVACNAWRELVEKDLKGAPFEKKLVSQTYEGIAVQPLYTADDLPDNGDHAGFPGLPPHTRGAHPLGRAQYGWDVCQEHAEPDPNKLNAAIRDDLTNGVRSILLRLDARNRPGAPLQNLADLHAALTEVPLEAIHIGLDAGSEFTPAATCLSAVWEKYGADNARGSFNADPLCVLADAGCLPVPLDQALDQMTDLAAWTSNAWPGVTSVGVNTAPCHRAGADAAQDLAISMATGIEYLRAMERGGMTVADAARQFQFTYHIGCRLFLAIAKLRAARRLWTRIIEAAGEGVVSMNMHVRTADRVLTQRDPWVNMLRNTICCFAAAVGGADMITLPPFDAAIGPPDAFSRRIARNTQLLLRDESHLHRVIDPAGGSWFIEKLTDELAQEAWGILQEIESRGGAASVLTSGWLAEQIESTWQARLKNIGRRKDPITGVSEFPNLHEEPIDKTPLDVASPGGAGPDGVTITPLKPHPLAEPFERLRDASDEWLARNGNRPRVFLANMGPIAHHTARATYSRNFFEAGGFEAIAGDGYPDADSAAAAFTAGGSSIAVICSSDKLYETMVAEVAPKLKQAGARTVVLAGRPGENEEAYRAAGVDRFIFIGCDVLATLKELLREEGVMS